MLPSGHPYYDIVLNIARRLVTTNQDFPGMASHKWTIWIVKNDEKNAFVLPVSENRTAHVRLPDKSVYWKFIFFISHPKQMLWVLKRTVSMRRFF